MSFECSTLRSLKSLPSTSVYTSHCLSALFTKGGGGGLGGPTVAAPDAEAEARRIKAGILEIVS